MTYLKMPILLSAIALMALSCGNNSAPKTIEKTEVVASEEHHHDATETIELNIGKKWKVDDNMMVYIQNIQNDVSAFDANSTKDYPKLAKEINKNIELLTSNCTMKGQAHDELHKWLVPFLGLAEAFEASKNNQEFEEHFQAIKSAFPTFHTYFE